MPKDQHAGQGLFAVEDASAANLEPTVDANAPLAARMRPQTLDEFAGQESIVGPGTLLRRAIENDQLTSAQARQRMWGKNIH